MLKRVVCTLAVVCGCWAATKPVILVQPGSVTGWDGGQVSFSVTATGNPAPTYQWQRLSSSTWGNVVACKTALCQFTAAATDNGAQFRVMVSNSAGSVASAAATLTVDFLDIVTQPVSQKVWAATAAQFAVTVRANPVPVAYQWYRQAPGQAVVAIPGATAAVYTTPVTTAQDDLLGLALQWALHETDQPRGADGGIAGSHDHLSAQEHHRDGRDQGNLHGGVQRGSAAHLPVAEVERHDLGEYLGRHDGQLHVYGVVLRQ